MFSSLGSFADGFVLRCPELPNPKLKNPYEPLPVHSLEHLKEKTLNLTPGNPHHPTVPLTGSNHIVR